MAHPRRLCRPLRRQRRRVLPASNPPPLPTASPSTKFPPPPTARSSFPAPRTRLPKPSIPKSIAIRIDGRKPYRQLPDPADPRALSPVVNGIVSLHDFRRTVCHDAPPRPRPTPQYPDGSTTIFTLPTSPPSTISTRSITGPQPAPASPSPSPAAATSTSRRRRISRHRRTRANAPTVTLTAPDPGLVPGDQDESTLDVEWAGASRSRQPSVTLVAAASTAETDGIDLSAAIHRQPRPRPRREPQLRQLRAADGRSRTGLLQQPLAAGRRQGISAVRLLRRCRSGRLQPASDSSGSVAAVNGLCSSPYSTCVGGTEFNDGSNPAQYWSPTNSASYDSALGYIPEEVWNESALGRRRPAFGLPAAAVSQIYPQPSLAKGRLPEPARPTACAPCPTSPSPRPATTATSSTRTALHYVFSGTSAAPRPLPASWPWSLQSKGGAGQGSANPALYPPPSAAHTLPRHAFRQQHRPRRHPASPPPRATYNPATGLGSVDAALLVGAWKDAANLRHKLRIRKTRLPIILPRPR